MNDRCLVCDSTDLEKLVRMFSKFLPRIWRWTAVCRQCGHVQLFPLFTEDEVETINEKFFLGKYVVGDNLSANKARKLEKLGSHLDKFIKNGMNVLDIGSGEAWALDYFSQHSSNYFAIESIDKFREYVKSSGGKVIGRDIDGDYSEYTDFFDIIVIRHLIEHLLNPIQVLKLASQLVKSSGTVFVACPNASHFSTKGGFRTSFLRPVHISYFSLDNLVRVGKSAGLECISSSANGELNCFFRCRDEKKGSDHRSGLNHYYEVKKLYNKMLRENLFQDLVKISKIYLRRIIK